MSYVHKIIICQVQSFTLQSIFTALYISYAYIFINSMTRDSMTE